ncbi:MAG: hypothetical protein V1846_01750 [Candidatus Komeilibacteria bacterium]
MRKFWVLIITVVVCLSAIVGCAPDTRTDADFVKEFRDSITFKSFKVSFGDTLMVKDATVTEFPAIGIGFVVVQRRSDGMMFNAKVRLPANFTAGQMVKTAELAYELNSNGIHHDDALWIVTADSTFKR